MPLHFLVHVLFSFVHALVACVAKHIRLFAVQQFVRLRDIMHVGRCALYRMHQARFNVHPNVRFHPKVPLVALLGLVHLRVALALAVLGRAGRGNQGRINGRSILERQTFTRQGGIDGGHQHLAQRIGFEQMTESQNRALIRQSGGPRIKLGKLTVQGHIMQRLFHGGIAQAKPLLQEVNPQHRLNGKGRAASLARRCKRLDHFNQLAPRHHQIHLIQELTFARALADQFKSGLCKCDLFHADLTLCKAVTMTYAEFP